LMGLCVLVLFPLALLKKRASEQGLLLILAVVIVVAFRTFALAAPLLKLLGDLIPRAGIDEMYIGVLLRTVAASLVSQLCADLCRDGGSQALATAVELTGGLSVLVIALPLLKAVIELLLRYIG